MLHLLDTKSLLLVALAWAAAAYLVVPALWVRHFRRHPFAAQTARITLTGDGHPGDPINIGLVGSEEDVVRAMRAAGWYPADPITLASSARIAADTVLRRADDDAPVSNLFLFGRKQDLAFEQPMPGGPGKRHHVRFWQWDQLYEGRHGWFGAATFDSKVGLSHTTGQVTHHIARTSTPSATAWSPSCSRPAWCSRCNGWTASTPISKAGTAAAIPGTPTAAWRS